MRRIERKYKGWRLVFPPIIAGCFLISIAGCLSCCKGDSDKSQKKSAEITPMDTMVVFKLPEIPVSINTPEGRGDYLIRHYWDNFDFNDTLSISKPEAAEQFFVDFVDISSRLSLPTAREGVTIFMQRSSQNNDVQNFFIGLLDKYLYDPNSPMRNEELYIPVLEYLVASPTVKSEDKTRAEYRLEMAMKNRPGSVATNFVFAGRDGQLKKLTDVKGKYIVLFFNNPGCTACKQISAEMMASAFTKNPKVTMLAIYPDADLSEWKETQHGFPDEWIDGYSPNGAIMEKELYDLKAIPTLYLLDENKKVVLKDATWRQIEMYLSLNLI